MDFRAMLMKKKKPQKKVVVVRIHFNIHFVYINNTIILIYLFTEAHHDLIT